MQLGGKYKYLFATIPLLTALEILGFVSSSVPQRIQLYLGGMVQCHELGSYQPLPCVAVSSLILSDTSVQRIPIQYRCLRRCNAFQRRQFLNAWRWFPAL
jgi:hypothetical protein